MFKKPIHAKSMQRRDKMGIFRLSWIIDTWYFPMKVSSSHFTWCWIIFAKKVCGSCEPARLSNCVHTKKPGWYLPRRCLWVHNIIRGARSFWLWYNILYIIVWKWQQSLSIPCCCSIWTSGSERWYLSQQSIKRNSQKSDISNRVIFKLAQSFCEKFTSIGVFALTL